MQVQDLEGIIVLQEIEEPKDTFSGTASRGQMQGKRVTFSGTNSCPGVTRGWDPTPSISAMALAPLLPILLRLRLTILMEVFLCQKSNTKRRLAAANHAFLIDILQVNTGLTSLNMSQNEEITDQGWAEFAKGLAVSIRASCHPMAPEKSSHDQYSFSMHFDPS